MRRLATLALSSLSLVSAAVMLQGSSPPFTVEQILSLPQPDNLVAAPAGSTIAWTFNERGVRNIHVAAAPDFKPRRLTPYTEDDGQELTSLSFTGDGKTIVYVRGGDHGSNRPADAPNPSASTVQPKVQIWSIATAGSPPRLIGEGDDPAVAPDSQRVAFVKDRRIWIAPVDGTGKPEAAFFARGSSESPVWSPDGRTLAFVSDRGDHSFIALFTPGGGQPIRYLAPSTSRDSLPAWSPDGRKIAFLRQPGAGGAPRSPLVQVRQKWSILVSDVSAGASAPVTAVTSGDSPIDPILQNPGGIGLRWAADDTLVFLSYRDGWPHLYSVQHPGAGGTPTLMTPGAFMVEHVTLSPDRRSVVYTANTGPDRNDVARRHLFKAAVNASTPVPLVTGSTIEWSPVVTGDGQTVAFLTSDARRPPLPAVVPLNGGSMRLVAPEHVPAGFPSAQLVVPEQVSFRASDGVEAHGQLFHPAATADTGSGGGSSPDQERGAGLPVTSARDPQPRVRHPAIVYIHGGGPRQMLLGWHNRWEYANDYGINQYLVSRGFIVLSVDYRLSVGYGQAFQLAERTGARGASEYSDVLAAGRYLQRRADVDPRRIGVWGASYGGYLTALALGRNSDVFAAGVDIHGVHDRLPAINPTQFAHAIVGDGITEPGLRQALKVEYDSSPISAVSIWKSPVLLIHGDDDRTVDFRQTVDLERRLLDKGVKVEQLVLPDDVHDSLLWRNWTALASATTGFFERMLQPR